METRKEVVQTFEISIIQAKDNEKNERLFLTRGLTTYFLGLETGCARRENIRADAGTTDDYLNDEELAADAAINDAFLR